MSNSDFEKDSITFREFVSTSVWSVKVVWKMRPGLTSIYILSGIVLSLLSFVGNFAMAKVIDTIIAVSNGKLDFNWVYYSVGLFFIISVFRYGFNLASRYSGRMIQSYFYAKFEEQIYTKMNALGIETLEQPKINNLLSRIQMNWRNFLTSFELIVSSISSLSAITTGGIIVFKFVPSVAPFLILVTVPYMYFDRKYTKLIWRKDKELTETRRSAYDALYQLTDSKSLQELTIVSGRKFLEKKFIDFREYWYNFESRERMRFFKQLFVLRLVREGIIAFADYTVIVRFIKGFITIGDVTFYFPTIGGFSGNIYNFTSSLTSLYESSLRTSEIKEFFEMEAVHKDGTKSLGKLQKGPEIIFRNVDFKYPNSEKLVIKGLNLTINAQEKIAIVGHNGAGKTTLVKLLCGFYYVNSGEILVNRANIKELKKDSLYENMGVLFQEFNEYRFLSAKHNIFIGDIKAKMNKTKIRRAAEKADASEFIEEFENKYDQILSEKYKGGVRPSTGMWQKLAIARFFYRNAPLVIFDEPTAAIDAVSEAKIFNRIYRFFKGKTVIIISHRFSTVRNADRIIVFDNGKVIEQGTHEDLIKLNGKYAKAFYMQAEGYK
ncbi:ABC transporter ATP-binding protein [Candidatus Microgenomates bacterium]|nr:MAG: ABC transporter ATP-binding protein [Candidatus Microgenomates bacterium]